MINKDELLKISPQALFGEEMKKHTTFRIGGPADAFVSVTCVEEVGRLISYCRESGTPYMIMGNGSNMLVSDKGIRGVVIQIGAGMADCRIDGEKVYAEAGILMSALANRILDASLAGFECASGIP